MLGSPLVLISVTVSLEMKPLARAVDTFLSYLCFSQHE